jgi:HK97 family phage major capsid protein
MEETSPVFARTRKIFSTSGSLKVPRETSTSVGAFVGEGQDMLEGALSLGEEKLEQKRVGALISITNQLVHDSAVPMHEYITNLLVRRTYKAIEKSMLIGSFADEFRGITKAEIAQVQLSNSNDTLSPDFFLDMINAVHPELHQTSAFFMSRAFFNRVSKMKDRNGHFFLQAGKVNGKIQYLLFGFEVFVSDVMDAGNAAGETPVVFGSVWHGYTLLIKKGIHMTHIKADTTNALRGSQQILLEAYMDGCVTNPDAFVNLVTV